MHRRDGAQPWHGGDRRVAPLNIRFREAPPRARKRGLIEWRVLLISITLVLYSFGYGGITSFTAMYADVNAVTPKSLYLTALAIVMLVTRPVLARLGDQVRLQRVFIPCLVLISLGLACLAARRHAVHGCCCRP